MIKAIQWQELERANLAASGPESEPGDGKKVPEPEAGSNSGKSLDSEHDLDHKFKSGRSNDRGAGGLLGHSNTIYISGGSVLTISQMTHVVNSIKEPDDLEERAMRVRNVLDGMDSYQRDLAPPRLVDKIHELLGKVLATKKGANMISRHDTLLTIGQVKPAVRFMVTYGNIPSISMAAGVACLALSTILLAAGAQSHVLGPEVWIICLLTMVGVVTLSFLPTRSAFI